jgi:hypothetical protein
MRIAVDIDGTLSREPDNIRELMKNLMHGRNRVIVLTGCLYDQPSEEERIKQLEGFGVRKGVHYTELIRVPGFTHKQVSYGKATYCRDTQIDIILEDDDEYISDINQMSPRTTCFLIRRWSEWSNEALMAMAAVDKRDKLKK